MTGELVLPIYSPIRPIQIPPQLSRTIPSAKSRRTAIAPRRGRSSSANGLAQFDEVVRRPRLAEYRKTKAAEPVVSALSPRLLQHIQDIARVQKTSRSRRE